MAQVHNLAADVRAFTSNVFLVEGDRTVLVDAGANFDVVERLEQHLDDGDGDRAALDAVLLTHTHPDHIDNLDSVRDAFDVETWGFDPTYPQVDHGIADGETVQIGDYEYVALHTPGHKDDHLCFYGREAGVLFAGDLVFQNGSYGRTDLEEGNHRLLVESIELLLEELDEEFDVMHAGHGPSVSGEPYGDVELAAKMARSAQ
ncbi:MBL fold metallo-hydrolase [Halospeciosus flavus]|uniref:MBL fold metallo-hydrolase n=1 Tax=Halospeciosus flavus TaxID=3032283 RepID=A0ABD5Z200_9EURY|nr:MBL fold metallo-hydrolase [Halospeciosus flavus]